MKNNPIISVVVTTYNHVKYIAQAIDSILVQKSCPEFEIIIGNDCSTDGSEKVIDKYAQAHPDLIRVLPRPKNLGMLENMRDCFENCRGDYIAICEGDDYWTDENKLLKQWTALESDTNATMCWTDIKLLKENNKITKHIPKIKKKLYDKTTFIDLIKNGNPIGNFSCCMYKKAELKKIPNSYYLYHGNADWLFNLYMLDNNYGIFIKDICSVYRLHNESEWSSKSGYDKSIEVIYALIMCDNLFDRKYHGIILKTINRLIPDTTDRLIPGATDRLIPGATNRFILIEKKLKKYRRIYKILMPATILLAIGLIASILSRGWAP